jgi:hypothetical protein
VQLERSRRKKPGQQAADTPIQSRTATRARTAPTGLGEAGKCERCNVCDLLFICVQVDLGVGARGCMFLAGALVSYWELAQIHHCLESSTPRHTTPTV